MAAPPQQVPGPPAAWTQLHIDSIRNKVIFDMHAGLPVLTHPLHHTMPLGDPAATALALALGDIFIVMIDPVAAIITLTPNVRIRRPSKVPRPKNCFVIYRLDKHIIIKALNPDLSNNDCSKIIAEMWRNEPQVVKDEYKRRADAERAQHALNYPGYQYQPRKPSEKKKRMTKNKVAKLATSSRPLRRNTQAPLPQLPLPVPAQAPQQQLPVPFPAQLPQQQPPVPVLTFADVDGPMMDMFVTMETGGDLLDVPEFKMPATKQRRAVPRSFEQKRQDTLDLENATNPFDAEYDMSQFFDFTQAIEDLPSGSLPVDTWDADWVINQ